MRRAVIGTLCVCALGASPALVRGNTPSADAPALKPRFVLRVPSVRRLLSEARRSRSHGLLDALHRMLIESAQASADGVDVANASALASMIEAWPDAVVEFATFARDLEGKARWIVGVNWTAAALQRRLRALLDLDAASSIFENVSLETRAAGSYVVRVSGEPLAFLLPGADGRSFLASHADLNPAALTFAGFDGDAGSAGPSVVQARLNLAKTEADSGATFLSSFRAVTAVDYRASVDEDGNWNEHVRVHWPPISGMGAKALFERVGQTFFVPDAAFGAVVVNTPMVLGTLDRLAGLGPQVVMEAPGKMELVGEPTPGPIASHVDAELCVALLPGTGFLPSPDFLVQVRTRRPERLIAAIRKDVQRINALFVERDRPEPWHELSVRDRAVFWSEPAGQPRGLMLPLVMRPVLFTTTETDAKGRARHFLVMGLTSTEPKAFVERWMNLPRTKNFRHLPSVRKTNGQAWVRWRKVYDWVSPYVNLALSGAGIDALLPSARSMASDLTDGLVTVKLKYSGLAASHSGPVPVGVLVVPVLLATSLEADEFGASDLARERLATQRLKLLYHHCKLFRADIGRWPAEIGELDGYVDFAGHPELLTLRLSAKKRWSEWFSGAAKARASEDVEDDEDDEGASSIKTDLYVIDWSHDAWSLGLKVGTLEHLDRLYVDQDGNIHRIERVPQSEADERAPKTDDQSQETEHTPNDQSDDGEEE